MEESMRVVVSMVGRNRTGSAILAAGLITVVGAGVAASDKGKRAEWRHYLGGQDSASYSSLTQINRSNVTELEVAWTYRAGPNNRLRFNPIVVDDVMYVLGKDRAIVALDAATGKELWKYEHALDDEFRCRLGERREDAAAVEPAYPGPEDRRPVEVSRFQPGRGFVTAVIEHDRRAHAVTTIAVDGGHGHP